MTFCYLTAAGLLLKVSVIFSFSSGNSEILQLLEHSACTDIIRYEINRSSEQHNAAHRRKYSL